MVLIVISQVLICELAVYEEDLIPEDINLVDIALEQDTDIILFGDSVMYWGADPRNGKLTIAAWIQKYLPRKSLQAIYKDAYQTEIYLRFCQYIIDQKKHPQLIIVPINLRVFSPEWHRRPEYQFEKEKIFLFFNNSKILQVFSKPLSVFKVFAPSISQYDFENTIVFNGDERVGKVADFTGQEYEIWSAKKMKKKIIFHYMQPLTESHPKLKALVSIAQLLKKHQIKVIFYITPVDYETAERYLGQSFHDQVEINKKQIKNHLLEAGVVVEDFSFFLGEEFFAWKKFLYPNEHLKVQARAIIANKLAQKVREIIN